MFAEKHGLMNIMVIIMKMGSWMELIQIFVLKEPFLIVIADVAMQAVDIRVPVS